MTGLMIMMDPPEHERARGLVGRVFTPRAVQAPRAHGGRGHRRHSGAVRRRRLVRRRGRLQRSLPGGDHLPDARGPRGGAPADPPLARPDARARARASATRPPRAIGAALELVSYFLELVALKRRRPGDDMVTRLTQAEMERPDGRTTRLDDERDRRLPQPPRRCRCRDGDQAGGQRRRALPPAPRPVRRGGRRPVDDPGCRRGGAAHATRRRSTRVATRSGTRSTAG